MSADGTTLPFNRDLADVLARQRLDTTTTLVEYRSAGHCLVVGPTPVLLAAIDALPATGATLVDIDPTRDQVDKQLLDTGTALFRVPGLSLTGHLGAYRAIVPGIAAQSDVDLGVSVRVDSGHFDVVVDAGDSPLIDAAVAPFGYLHVPGGAGLREALAGVPELTGTFEKPRYFRYDAKLCAHARSSQVACTRCIDSCATGAISADGDGIRVDPYRCQGCGSCAVTCPSGAIRYAYPPVSRAIGRSREMLADSGATGVILHTEALQPGIDDWLTIGDGGPHTPDHATAARQGWLPVQVEEITAWGIDYWASLCAAGVSRILLLHDEHLLAADAALLDQQAALLHTILGGIGIEAPVVARVDVSELLSATASPPSPYGSPGAAFTTHDDKRQTFRLAMDSLRQRQAGTGALPEAATHASHSVSLPAGSPFGRIAVDTSACTLCMACVSLCPGRALLDGQERPALRIVEANCLQCGLCRDACPESAIALEPRYLYDDVAARHVETLHEEAPFHCIVCHKPFATHRMIDTMLGKLGNHWMFANPEALRRLKMCEDCRVRDIFEKDASGIDVHRGGSE